MRTLSTPSSVATGRIVYRTPAGTERTWDIQCHAIRDSPKTLRRHLERWRPKAIFVRAEIITEYPVPGGNHA